MDIKEKIDKEFEMYPQTMFPIYFNSEGYKCMVTRITHTGAYCGYVFLPENHPDWKLDLDLMDHPDFKNIHGNITYIDGEMVGFDCSHGNDVYPSDFQFYGSFEKWLNANTWNRKKHFWTFDEVKAETQKLARQFKDREEYDIVADDELLC